MNKDEMKKVALVAFLFAILSISIVMYRSATRHVFVNDNAEGAGGSAETGTGYTLLIDESMPDGHSKSLIIPLPRDAASDRVDIDHRDTERELLVYVDSRDEGFYRDNVLHTDLAMIESAVCRETDSQGGVCLDFKLDGIYACDAAFPGDGLLELTFCPPSERYSHLVVIDPAGGGSSGAKVNGLLEKNITLETALLLKEMAESDENNEIKLYFTRLSDNSVDGSKRNRLAGDLAADLYVELSAGQSDDADCNGVETGYNDRFYLRDMTNAELAYILEKKVAENSGAAALGVKALQNEDDVLMQVRVPAANVCLGYLTGNKDGTRLQDDNYKKRLARGIYEAIKMALEEKE